MNTLNNSERHPQRSLQDDRFDLVIQKIYEKIAPLADKVELATPGHKFGRCIIARMMTPPSDGFELATSEGLNPQDTKLVATALAIHDIGRIICQAEKPGDKAYQHEHGRVGAQFLQQNNLLASLPEDEAFTILAAVEFHSAKTVELPKDSLAFKICALVRDLDRFALLSNNESFMSPSGVLTQLSMWMLDDREKQSLSDLSDQERAELLLMISSFMSGATVDAGSGIGTLEKAIISKLSRAIPDSLQEKVSKGELPTKEDSIYGYPSYMLSHLAQLNDITTKSVLNKIVSEGLLEQRIAYLKVVSPEITPIIDFLLKRLPTDR